MLELFQDTGTWVLLSFCIFAVFAYKKGKDKFIAMLDDRIMTVRKEIETAESLRIEAQELLAQYERKQKDARQEAERIVKTAKEHAIKIKKQAEIDLEETMVRREQQLETRLHRMEEDAIQEIRSHAAELSVRATLEIINEKLNKTANNKLIDATIKNIEGQLN